MKAKIQVSNKVGEVINEYELEYGKPIELQKLLKDARKVWEEYHIKAITPTYDISFSHTYKEERILNKFS